jgi:signal transduction histidine kinase
MQVVDHGPGGADPNGAGLRHLADRVEAHGGSLHLDSPLQLSQYVEATAAIDLFQETRPVSATC